MRPAAAPALPEATQQSAMEQPGKASHSTPVPGLAIWNRSPWNWLFSIRVGIVLLTIITIASTVGTLIDPLERAQAVIYYTWWFKLLLIALAINMSCATVMTVMQKTIPSFRMKIHTQKGFYEASALATRFSFGGSIEDVAAAFRKQGFKVRTEGNAGAARTGWFGNLGAPISHLGLVIVLIAGFAASWIAREGTVQIPEGSAANTMKLRGSDEVVPLGFTLRVNDFATGFFPRTRIPSHFVSDVSVEQADGSIVYTGKVEVNNSPLIHGWYLHQTSYSELKGLPRHEVEIKGPAGESATLEMSPGQSLPVPGIHGLTIETDQQMKWSLKKDGAVVASGAGATHSHAGDLSVLADRFEPDFVLGADRQITSRSQEMNNPALRVQLLSKGQVASAQWLFAREDMKGFSHSTNDHFKIELVDVLKDAGEPRFVLEVSDAHENALIGRVTLTLGQEAPVGGQPAPAETPASTDEGSGWSAKVGARVPAYATVMTLTSNPAIPIIYAACLLMMVGLVIGFFVRRRDVWFLLDGPSGQLRVIAHYRHPSEQFDGATRAALARLQPPTAAN